MAINIHSPGVEISASTTTANAALPNSNAGYLYVVNNSADGIAYVNAGADNTVTATSANPGVPPRQSQYFIRDVNNDKFVAVKLSVGGTAGLVSVTVTNNPLE